MVFSVLQRVILPQKVSPKYHKYHAVRPLEGFVLIFVMQHPENGNAVRQTDHSDLTEEN